MLLLRFLNLLVPLLLPFPFLNSPSPCCIPCFLICSALLLLHLLLPLTHPSSSSRTSSSPSFAHLILPFSFLFFSMSLYSLLHASYSLFYLTVFRHFLLFAHSPPAPLRLHLPFCFLHSSLSFSELSSNSSFHSSYSLPSLSYSPPLPPRHA